MGRRKKIVELEEIGKVEKEKNLIEDLKTKESSVERNKKKWENLIIRSYKQQLVIDKEKLNSKIQEKYNTDLEVKNIISELKIKIKDLEYMTKKQWQILKKFNLQEKIYREEGKLLSDSERMKKEDFYKEAIEKLTAAHVGGFEPAFVLKNKILSKVQQKYEIADPIMMELRKLNYDMGVDRRNYKKSKNKDRDRDHEDILEEELLANRNEDQILVLENFIKENFLNSKNKEKDKDYDNMGTYFQNKQELKRYEKEIELKAGKGTFSIDDDIYRRNYESNTSSFNMSSKNKNSGMIMENDKSHVSIFELPSNTSYAKSNYNKSEHSELINDYSSYKYESYGDYPMSINEELENSRNINKFDSSIKVKDILKVNDLDTISKFKEKIIDEMSEKAKSNEYISKINIMYKSKILNEMYMKLTILGKLSDYDLQILIFLSHVVVRDVVQAKITNKNYEGLVDAEELVDFMNRFKSELEVLPENITKNDTNFDINMDSNTAFKEENNI